MNGKEVKTVLFTATTGDRLQLVGIVQAETTHGLRDVIRAVCRDKLSWFKPDQLHCDINKIDATENTQISQLAIEELAGLPRLQDHCYIAAKFVSGAGITRDYDELPELREELLVKLGPMKKQLPRPDQSGASAIL